ncbi:protocatechuate 3,4-dioxygenase subunit beta [Streptomyces sp. AV19]|uniref:dioxygenase family protein n=1 Tax=Streptomyces sp. AV19 TaxID=2793068 RepID=UPI0018FEE6B5|nr:protocatechuate 3,4-dioxygenase subunit beta [Streptomyces sp. AV19]MBH1938467.1 protocatechuate 3,4-dioxygenase subunit beta [Streptomyces sp. AV19]MDG4535115.1 protocatechuate 3,4-dioxygenase subunit beta [Streptomyces sp. AV19]
MTVPYVPYSGIPRRQPQHPPVLLPSGPEAAELTGPVFGPAAVGPLDHDLTRQHAGEPRGERITVSGRILDRRGRPVRGQLIEIWQANAAGRYAHPADRNPAPPDPDFTGTGRCLTDDEGRYRFTTIRPGAYPVDTSWRPAHIHFSLFGTAFAQRLVTQMYFPGDPLLARDGIHHAVHDPAARRRLIAAHDPALGYRWDVVLDGPRATWTEGTR